MRHLNPRRLLVLYLVTGVMVAGCASDPRAQWAQGREALTAAELKLVEAAEAGTLTRTEILLIDPFVQAGRAALNDAERRIDEGDTSGFKADMRAFAAILQRLTQLYLPPPATQPTQ